MKGNIVPGFIATDKMLADGLSKPYSGPEIQTYLPETGTLGVAMKVLEKEEKEWNLEVVVLTSCLALLAPIISTVPPSVPPHTTNPLDLDMGSSLFMLRACSGTSRQHPGADPPLHSQFDLCCIGLGVKRTHSPFPQTVRCKLHYYLDGLTSCDRRSGNFCAPVRFLRFRFLSQALQGYLRSAAGLRAANPSGYQVNWIWPE
jgi:hypothetical protein